MSHWLPAAHIDFFTQYTKIGANQNLHTDGYRRRLRRTFEKVYRMRTLCLVAVLCIPGCSQTNRPTPAGTPAVQDLASITVDVDGSSGQHPLVCGVGRDFPAGHELAFRGSQSRELVHAVFPEGVTPPKTLDGRLVLHGHYQGIQKRREGRRVKRVPKDYQYFVVSSWEHEK